MQLFLGTSGYSYKDWVGIFYPKDLAERDFLRFYSEIFNSVEINSTFYRTPFKNVVIGWDKKTPDDFGFVCKASRYITHIERLKVEIESVYKVLWPLSPIMYKLKALLWQFPPNMKKNLVLLSDFLVKLQKVSEEGLLHCFEFRHSSWFCDEIFSLLDEKHCCFVWYDAPKNFPKTPLVSTNNCVYLRFHGKKNLYKGRYSHDDLLLWIKKIKNKNPKRCFVFFNNDYNGDGIFDAKVFKELWNMS